MNFLKENLFLVITGAVVVVFGSVALLMASSWGNQADAGGKKITSMGGRISSLASGGVNEDGVAEARKRDEGMQHQKVTVADTFLRRNRRGYEVLSFGISGQTVPAFPTTACRDRGILRQLFPQKYRLEVANLLKTLQPTAPPTDDELKAEIARISASTTPTEAKPVRTTTSIRRDDGGERGGGERGSRGDVRPTRLGDATNDIERQALISLVVGKSEQGWIYADKTSTARGGDRLHTATGGDVMHMALTRSSTSGFADYTDAELYMAQVGLWVQKDIIGAINLTNQQVQKTAPGNQKGVAASAVKQLINIDVRGFVLGGSSKGATLQYMDLGLSKGGGSVPRLTGRACNKLYDVVHYEFTVIIPMRHLLQMETNLMSQNYHTILETNMVKPAPSDSHYYGTDPVMKVTIVGEMLLLTDWTRGRWDEEAKDWDENYPPLMPVEGFLETIKDTDPGAIRSEDNKREGMSSKTRSGSAGRPKKLR